MTSVRCKTLPPSPSLFLPPSESLLSLSRRSARSFPLRRQALLTLEHRRRGPGFADARNDPHNIAQYHTTISPNDPRGPCSTNFPYVTVVVGVSLCDNSFVCVSVRVCVCVCVCARARVRACVRVRVRACVRDSACYAPMRASLPSHSGALPAAGRAKPSSGRCRGPDRTAGRAPLCAATSSKARGVKRNRRLGERAAARVRDRWVPGGGARRALAWGARGPGSRAAGPSAKRGACQMGRLPRGARHGFRRRPACVHAFARTPARMFLATLPGSQPGCRDDDGDMIYVYNIICIYVYNIICKPSTPHDLAP